MTAKKTSSKKTLTVATNYSSPEYIRTGETVTVEQMLSVLKQIKSGGRKISLADMSDEYLKSHPTLKPESQSIFDNTEADPENGVRGKLIGHVKFYQE